MRLRFSPIANYHLELVLRDYGQINGSDWRLLRR